MGDHLQAGKPPQTISPSHPGQLSLLLSLGQEKYRPKCSDALRMCSKGRCGSFHLQINVWVAGDHSLTRAIPERLRDDQLIIKCYTSNASFTVTCYYYFHLTAVLPCESGSAGSPSGPPLPPIPEENNRGGLEELGFLQAG